MLIFCTGGSNFAFKVYLKTKNQIHPRTFPCLFCSFQLCHAGFGFVQNAAELIQGSIHRGGGGQVHTGMAQLEAAKYAGESPGVYLKNSKI